MRRLVLASILAIGAALGCGAPSPSVVRAESQAHSILVQADVILALAQANVAYVPVAITKLRALAANSPTLAAVLLDLEKYLNDRNVSAARAVLGVLIAETDVAPVTT